MDKEMKEKGPKPFQLIKALFQCALLFCLPGLFITFFAPSSTIDLIRVNKERVDAIVIKKILFIVPMSKDTATDLQVPGSRVIDGGVIRKGRKPTGRIIGHAEDEGLLILKGLKGASIEVNISPKNLADVTYDIQNFIIESKEPSSRLWVTSNWKFGVILPGGILLLCFAIFFMASWSIITGKSLEDGS